MADASYSVVVRALNAARTLRQVLESLPAQDPGPAEVIVVDDGSTDATAQVAEVGGATVVSTAAAEWTLGATALRYAARRPSLRGGSQPLFE